MSIKEYLKVSIASTTQGRVVFLIQWGICCASIFAIVFWMPIASVLVLGFIAIAQQAIGAFFKHPDDTPYKRFNVAMSTIGYVLLMFQSLRVWNEAVSHEVMAGITVFGLRIVTEYYTTIEEPKPTETPTGAVV